MFVSLYRQPSGGPRIDGFQSAKMFLKTHRRLGITHGSFRCHYEFVWDFVLRRDAFIPSTEGRAWIPKFLLFSLLFFLFACLCLEGSINLFSLPDGHAIFVLRS